MPSSFRVPSLRRHWSSHGAFLVPLLGLRGSSGGDSRLLVPVFQPTVCGLPGFHSTAPIPFGLSPCLWGEAGCIYLDMSERRHRSQGGTRHVSVLCSSSGRRLPFCGAEANLHGLRVSPVAVHLVVDVPVVFFSIPVVAQRHFPWSRLFCGPQRFPSRSWTRLSMPYDRCRVDPECRIVWEFRNPCRGLGDRGNSPVVRGQGGRSPCIAGGASSTGAVVEKTVVPTVALVEKLVAFPDL